MSIRMKKKWQPLTLGLVEKLPAQLGIYQIADETHRVIYIGYAGGKSLWGLRSALRNELSERKKGYQFRIEINQQYLTRWEELLMVHQDEYGTLPMDNEYHQPRRLGTLSLY